MAAPNQSIFSKKMILNNGVEMPAVGISTCCVRTIPSAFTFVDNALGAGYRLFDTAPANGNEVALKHAFNGLLSKYGLDRSDIFITSKLYPMSGASYIKIKRELEKTLKNLGVEYIDLYVVNNPCPGSENRKRIWSVMQSLYDEGVVSAIGVSSFMMHQLRQITTSLSAPMVHQIRWDKKMYNNDMYWFCHSNDIVLQAFSPCGLPFTSEVKLFTNPIVVDLASKYDVPPPYVILMWALQKEVAVLPMSASLPNMEHLYMNFSLSASELLTLDDIVPQETSDESEQSEDDSI